MSGNEDVIRRFNEAIQAEDRTAFEKLIGRSCRLFCNDELEATDPEGYWEVAKAFRHGFPDLQHKSDELLVVGDRVVESFTVTGTHTGTFQGVAPTGRPIRITGVAIFRVVDGVVAEDRTIVDLMSLFAQLGALALDGADA